MTGEKDISGTSSGHWRGSLDSLESSQLHSTKTALGSRGTVYPSLLPDQEKSKLYILESSKFPATYNTLAE